MKGFAASVLMAACLFACHTSDAHIPTQAETIQYRKQLDQLDARSLPKCLSIPEGAFVYYYHPEVKAYLEQPFTPQLLKEIEQRLRPSLEIPFTKEGFTQAVPCPEEDLFGQVSYSAIWVRDCVWHYYGLKIHHPEAAAKLLLSLLRFYSTDQQIGRFLDIIQHPEKADPELEPMAHMHVPLIRFSSTTLSHHQADGKDQEWNHIQFDSHGLFLLALSDALSAGILPEEELKREHFEVLALFPAFFTQTNYAEKKDAGPWEEALTLNASSAGLVASGLKRIREVIEASPYLTESIEKAIERLRQCNHRDLSDTIASAFSRENVERLYSQGLARVEKNLRLGGEAPNVDGQGLDRRADAALLFLALLDHTPFFEKAAKIEAILQINAALIGPYGIYRYKYDPYQTLNYWVTFDVPSAISGASTPQLEALAWWNKGYMPHQQPDDAQWFFDACFADLYYRLSMLQQDKQVRAYYLKHGDIHLKRALGQLTGPDSTASNGAALEALQTPESINTVFDGAGSMRPLPSPICPLSWAKASLQMAIARAQSAHAVID